MHRCFRPKWTQTLCNFYTSTTIVKGEITSSMKIQLLRKKENPNKKLKRTKVREISKKTQNFMKPFGAHKKEMKSAYHYLQSAYQVPAISIPNKYKNYRNLWSMESQLKQFLQVTTRPNERKRNYTNRKQKTGFVNNWSQHDQTNATELKATGERKTTGSGQPEMNNRFLK